MTTDYKAVLDREIKNKCIAELKLQSSVILYQAALLQGDDLEEQKLRAQIHALTDLMLDSMAVQVHCLKRIEQSEE